MFCIKLQDLFLPPRPLPAPVMSGGRKTVVTVQEGDFERALLPACATTSLLTFNPILLYRRRMYCVTTRPRELTKFSNHEFFTNPLTDPLIYSFAHLHHPPCILSLYLSHVPHCSISPLGDFVDVQRSSLHRRSLAAIFPRRAPCESDD